MPVVSDVTSQANALFEAELQSLVENPLRRPGTTYRLQMHKGFRLEDVRAIVPYLHTLGVTDVYLSPYLDARPGSTHGYDVFDHSKINPEVGNEAEHAHLVRDLADRGMGRVLDIVPNHVGINGPNRFWLDVLEMGPNSTFSAFFDIDWHPVKDELEGRVLLPILDGQYGEVLEAGRLVLEQDREGFSLRYGEMRLPLSPQSLGLILGRASGEVSSRLDHDDPGLLEFLSIWDAALRLPLRTSTRPEDLDHCLRERRVLPRRVANLREENPVIRESIDRAVASFRGTPGDASSFDPLHELLEQQVYRLASWRVAAQEINYRRFFDINDLAGLRTEDPRVFKMIHAKIFDWVSQGGVTALRIDHPDGLADPVGYFQRLQETLFLIRCRSRFDAEGDDPRDWLGVASAIRKRFRASMVPRVFPIVAEKILSRGEDLPREWPIDGTVGYEYLNVLNGVFVDSSSAEAINACYAEFTGDREPFTEMLYRSKNLITQVSLASEINALARQLNRVSEHDRKSRDFTLDDLRSAIRETIVCFPVYRTYIRPGEAVTARDHGTIENAIATAKKRAPSLDASLFVFLRSCLMMEIPEGSTIQSTTLREAFVRRFQQTTGPVQAKGLEDTAFYRQIKLASLNEVGADPWRFGNAPGVFHAMNAQRLIQWPGSLNTTATHDTKRGEDARIRVNVLSEIPDEWKLHLARWSRALSQAKVDVQGAVVPDPREEYLFYQTLIAAWPQESSKQAIPDALVDRVTQYMDKAAREAKIHTSWEHPESPHCDALSQFVRAALQGSDASAFLRDFLPFQRRIARVGIVHSLSQTLLKLVSPGVPDLYQGCEFWDFSLVDPDNRRPVDYEARETSLAAIDREIASGRDLADLGRQLFRDADTGAIKQYIIAQVLRHRCDHIALYATGSYRPLETDGASKDRVVAFGRHHSGDAVIAVAPRLVAGLMGDDGTRPPLGRDVWGSTRILLPDGSIPRLWRDRFTGRVVEVEDVDGSPSLFVGDLLRDIPVALLLAEGAETA